MGWLTVFLSQRLSVLTRKHIDFSTVLRQLSLFVLTMDLHCFSPSVQNNMVNIVDYFFILFPQVNPSMSKYVYLACENGQYYTSRKELSLVGHCSTILSSIIRGITWNNGNGYHQCNIGKR